MQPVPHHNSSLPRLLVPYAAALLALQLLTLLAAIYLPDTLLPALLLPASLVLSALVLTLLARRLHRHWTQPLHTLTATATHLSAGQWTTRAPALPDSAADEIQDLATRLNAIAAKASHQLAEREEQRRVMQALVDTLPDPVLLVQAHRRLSLINHAAGRLLGVSPATAANRWLGEIVKDRALLETLDAFPPVVTAAATPSAPLPERELRLDRDGQHLTYHAVAAPTADGLLLVLRDVSALAETVRMKTDFVANASHELRTPVAAIKAAFETLRDVHADDPHQTDRCLRIIDGHLHRLEDLLRDLLDLSRLESPEPKVTLAPVHPAELFANLRATFAETAAAKHIELRATADSDAPFPSDPRLLHLILKNLTENALKFTPPGGQVTISLTSAPPQLGTGNWELGTPPSSPQSTTLLLSVTDTGIGIPPEHAPRVFERFYQVDPARSGPAATRGTGLGLAIVKHAVTALGGSVSLSSRPSQGTTVTCSLPLPATAPSPA